MARVKYRPLPLLVRSRRHGRGSALIRFPKRKSKPKLDELAPVEVEIDVELDDPSDRVEELELTDDDFILLEEAPPEPSISQSVLRAALAAVPAPPTRRPISEARLETLRTKTLRAGLPESRGALPAAMESVAASRESRRSFSRLQVDEAAVSSVADECLASIAAAASHARGDEHFAAPRSSAALTPLARSVDPIDDLLEVPAVGRLPRISPPGRSAATIPPAESKLEALVTSEALVLAARLPAVRPPPFVRSFANTSTIRSPSVPGLIADDADAAATLPNPVKTPFARRMTDERASVPPPPPSNDSVAPVALARDRGTNANGKGEATVIVVRERPRALWVVAAAAIGALAAVTVMRVVPQSAPAPPIPASHVTAAAPRPGPAVVRFGEDEGVSIQMPTPASPPMVAPATRVAHPAPRVSAPAAPTTRVLNPKVSAPTPMPDGSLGLASTGKAASTSSVVATPAPAPLPLPPGPARKRALTPEQELAEAQLRAATR
ncbi:MAG: hypothetical protein K0S65_774, partial [Labilithrix sp.]|nr:hypothetical protein [Labilithrix sp.]